jgi:hypothetical protein
LPRTPAKVTQADVARVLRAVKQTGTSARVEVKPDGSIVIIPSHPEDERRKAKVELPREIVL